MAHNHYTQIQADAGQAQRAIARLLRQAENYPNDSELFTGLVQATRYCGLLEESIAAHQCARRLDRRTVTSVAHTYFLCGDYERTLEWYPPGSRFYLDAAALAAMGRETEAAKLLRGRSCPDAARPISSCCLAGDHAGSIGVAMGALESVWPPEPEIRFYLARHLAHATERSRRRLKHAPRLTEEGFVCSTAMRSDPWSKPLPLTCRSSAA